MIQTSVESLVGHTPLIELTNIEREYALEARLIAKLEGFNPAGSAKDRVALAMLNAAEKSGELRPGGTVIEPTSGNTGIGLAAIGAARGYRVIIVMPDTMSKERVLTIRAYGAEVILTPGDRGMAGCIEKAEALHAGIPGSIIPGQFDNPANPQAHFDTTGPELWQDCGKAVDCFVMGIGTGGTITGVGRYLKAQDPAIRVIGIEPDTSPLLSKGFAGAHGLQGIGANFIPGNLDRSVIDEIITVSLDDAVSAARLMGRKEGLLIGISSGAALAAAIRVAKRPEYRGKTITTLFTDGGERYLSTGLFGE